MNTHTIAASEKCICLEDNKLTQALCPVHGCKDTPQSSPSWEEGFDEKFIDEISLEDGNTPLFNNRAMAKNVKSFIHTVEQDAIRSTIEKAIECVPEKYREEWIKEDRPFTSKQMIGWNKCREDILKALRSMLNNKGV